MLRFYGQWDDTANMFGTKTNFRVMYYLANDTLSVSEDHVANSGKDHFPDLIRRIRVSGARCARGRVCVRLWS